MTTEFVKEQNFEKQMGCMAGFLQIFDRHQILTGKRLYAARRLLPSPGVDTASDSDKSAPPSPAKPVQLRHVAAPGFYKPKQIPEAVEMRSPMAELPPKSPLPFQFAELKEGHRLPWKFNKEAPRLSLDSRATTDAKGGLHPTDGGQHHQCPGVIAKLMGLEPLPDLSGSESERKPELRRSASESRVSKDLLHSRFTADGSNFYPKQSIQSPSSHAIMEKTPRNACYTDPNRSLKNAGKAEPLLGLNRGCLNSTSPWCKSFFDSGDVFPEPRQGMSIYGEIEKRLKKKGMDEPSKDLETLKQILEALQLKGLLHPKQFQHAQVRQRNFVYNESPIVLLKTSGSSASHWTNRRMMENNYSPFNGRYQVRGVRRNYILAGETSPSASPRRERNLRSPIGASRSSSPTARRSEGNASARRLNTLTKPSPPKVGSRTAGPDPKVHNRSSKKSASETKDKFSTILIAGDESSSTSGSSSTDTERSKTEESKGDQGRSLLERCDKLLHSIAEMGAVDVQQPSPVSVLDPAFYKDELLAPSPITTKRSINFKDQSGGAEEEIWSPVVSPIRCKCLETSEDSDFVYISDILRTSHYLPDSDIFLLLEKQQYLKGNDMSKLSRIHRKLIFDTIYEILNRSNRLPPWTKANIITPSLDKVWSEFQRIKEHETTEDLFEIIGAVLRKDLVEDTITGWGHHSEQMSETVLDLERLIFKDLFCDAIRDLASSRGTMSPMMPRKKLIF